MTAVLSAGDAVGLLVPTANSAQSWQAACVGVSPNAVALVTPDRTFPVDLGEVILVVGAPGQRLFAPATFVKVQLGAHVFRLNRGWRAFDGRSSKRFPVNIPAQVSSLLGGSRQPGKVVDVSLGGAGVMVENKPGGRELELSMQSDGYAARLPATLVRHEQRPGSVLLHLQFNRLTLVQQAFVRNLIERLQAVGDEQRLAS